MDGRAGGDGVQLQLLRRELLGVSGGGLFCSRQVQEVNGVGRDEGAEKRTIRSQHPGLVKETASRWRYLFRVHPGFGRMCV